MPVERNAFKLGLSITVFIALAVMVIVFLAPRGGGDMTLRVRFPHHAFTTILKPGSEVVCGGVTVGSVRSLELVEMPPPDGSRPTLYAVVTAKVESSLGLREDCRIIPEGLLLGGPGKLIILDRGVARPVESSQMIDGVVVPDFSALTRTLASQLDPKDPTSLLAIVKSQLDAGDAASLMGKIHASLDDINAVTVSLRNQFNPREKEVLIAKLHGILDNVNGATRLLRDELDRAGGDAVLIAKVHRTLDMLNGGLSTVVAVLNENRQPVTETITHIRNTAEVLERQIAARIARELDPAEAAGLLAKVHVAVDRLGTSLKDANVITDSARQLVVVNEGQLGQMLVNLKETSDHLKAASKEIRRNPWRLFYQPTLEEAAQANVFDAARSFSEAATRLDDALGRLQALSKLPSDSPGRDAQIEEVLRQVQQTFSRFSQVETALWEQLNVK